MSFEINIEILKSKNCKQSGRKKMPQKQKMKEFTKDILIKVRYNSFIQN